MDVEVKIVALFFTLEQDEEIIAYKEFLRGLKRDELEELLRLHLQARQKMEAEPYGQGHQDCHH
jgi:hypothetical protein